MDVQGTAEAPTDLGSAGVRSLTTNIWSPGPTDTWSPDSEDKKKIWEQIKNKYFKIMLFL